MTNAEAATTENAATVAEQGAHVAPEKASSKTFDPGLPLDRRQEARSQDRVHED